MGFISRLFRRDVAAPNESKIPDHIWEIVERAYRTEHISADDWEIMRRGVNSNFYYDVIRGYHERVVRRAASLRQYRSDLGSRGSNAVATKQRPLPSKMERAVRAVEARMRLAERKTSSWAS